MNKEDDPSRPVLETVGEGHDALELAARKQVWGITRGTAAPICGNCSRGRRRG
jgi:hypothetical protein